MAFVDLQNFSTPPPKICGAPTGNILDAFPAKPIDAHSRLGYSFRSEPCNTFEDYDADICVDPSAQKMDPETYGLDQTAELRVIQSAFKCSAIGATDSELREFARSAVARNLWRSVDGVVVGMLDADDVSMGAAVSAICAYSTAVQFLAENSYCGTGVIYGSASWFVRIAEDFLVRDGAFWRDLLGNIVVPSSIDSPLVYAFDSEVEVRTSDIDVLDDYAPGITSINDRVVRAEMLYTVAMDNCAIGSIGVTDCA